jgi:riboflavin synthase
MFTGLIQDVGQLTDIIPLKKEATLILSSHFNSFTMGESIAINGACLSVTDFSGSTFSVFASEETLMKTGFDRYTKGTSVNLEKALRLGDSVGGHMVTGHVDAQIVLLEKTTTENASKMTFALPENSEIAKQIVPKGSVALNGVSLTVNDVTSTTFDIMVIPVTLTHSNLGDIQTGNLVNLETDILAKYVSAVLNNNLNSSTQNKTKSIDLTTLIENGFMR